MHLLQRLYALIMKVFTIIVKTIIKRNSQFEPAIEMNKVAMQVRIAVNCERYLTDF